MASLTDSSIMMKCYTDVIDNQLCVVAIPVLEPLPAICQGKENWVADCRRN